MNRAVYVVGTFDTKRDELNYVAGLLRAAGLPVVRVDVGTRSDEADVELAAAFVAGHHPDGADAVLRAGSRGEAVTAMTIALQHCLRRREDIGGVIGLGGSGGSAIIGPALQQRPLGLPKLLVSTLASGDTSPYVGVSDILMLFPVTDIAGLNRLSRAVLGNAARAMAGMMQGGALPAAGGRPLVALSMFGVTTPCVTQVRELLEPVHECVVFHANGSGGKALEALVDAGMVDVVADLTTTETVDYLFDGVCSAGPDRFEAAIRTGTPWVGSCGALDMINFWAPETVPTRHAGRHLHAHNARVTLMRTTADELREAARWLADKVNRAPGPVRWLLPERGFSMLDAAGQPFSDPQADAAFIETFEALVLPSDLHQVIRVPANVNDPAFARVAAEQVRALLAARPPRAGGAGR